VKFFDLTPPWLLPLILFLVALFVGLIKVRNLWEEVHEDDDPVSDHERLKELEEAYAAGELETAEFERIRLLLGDSAPRSVRTTASSRSVPLRGTDGVADRPTGREERSSEVPPVEPETP